ncbi:MurR/RpiR family transcriptional regulator [Desulfospira joergensenii]|uniref:MurR/RpiR family transcriptional regulator n=1 Tax=Desulfospira joergensenii TaxID=53329 RepID=UPI0003B6A76D|nr:MurR/RpiR family transcriptional regulator [Desulfospira joergensenii]
MTSKNESLQTILNDAYDTLAGKGKLLAEFVLASPDKAVFMTTRQLGAAVGVSEATVVRFVRQLGFESYAKFISSIRDLIDRKFTLMERERMSHPVSGSEDRELDRLINQDIADIKAMHKRVDRDQIKTISRILKDAPAVYVMGARLSFSTAHYMGWTMAKIREHVHILNGSDRTSMDQMVLAPEGTVVVIIATSRYPNELIRMGKIARRQKFSQILITDTLSCPLAPLSDQVLIAPLTTVPFLGNPASLVCLIHYLLNCLAAEMGENLKTHQEKLEQAYRENDIWFN